MNSLGTRYTMYFNKKHDRIGPLYQDVYKAVLIESDEQLLHLSSYIHRQSLNANTPNSYQDYLKLRKTNWVKPDEILAFFSKNYPKSTYRDFVSQQNDHLLNPSILLENDS